MPRPLVTGAADLGGCLLLDVALEPVPPGGIRVPDPSCGTTPIAGYRVYQQVAGPGQPVPVERRRVDGAPGAGWEPAVGGSGPPGEALPIGAGAQVTATDCVEGGVLHLAAALVFDGGFETPFLSAGPPPVPCGTCTAMDSGADGHRSDKCAARAFFDRDGGDPSVYPGAPQICDGLNNDCAHAGWPALEGTSETDNGDGRGECDGDPCPADADDDGDADGLCGDADNCRAIANPGRADAGGDGLGDPCPLAADAVCADRDVCRVDFDPAQEDADQDDLGDACDRFGATTTVTSALEDPISVAAADRDGDGDQDVVACGGVLSNGGAVVAWYENVAGDGDRDVLYGSAEHLAWCENRGDPGLAWPIHVIGAVSSDTLSAVAADFATDGDLDVASAPGAALSSRGTRTSPAAARRGSSEPSRDRTANLRSRRSAATSTATGISTRSPPSGTATGWCGTRTPAGSTARPWPTPGPTGKRHAPAPRRPSWCWTPPDRAIRIAAL